MFARTLKAPTAGFTLVEILVVLTIISILAGLVTVSLQHARRLADGRTTRLEIQSLVAAAESYKNAFGDYPPTFFSLPKLTLSTNKINEGNESLIAHISTRKKGGPFHGDFSDNRLENLDADQLSKKDQLTITDVLDWTRGNAKLLEYCDMWGDPFVYIHHRDYNTREKLLYLDRQGETVQVAPAQSEKTGTYQNPTSFQIWSFGPNGVNENGQGDDIVSWRE